MPVTVQGSVLGYRPRPFPVLGQEGREDHHRSGSERLGSGMDPVLAVYDSSGHELADEAEAVPLGGDPRLFFTASRETAPM